MELVASLPPDLLTAADPLARGPAPLLRSADADGGTNPAALPFQRFLELLDTALPGGEALPVDGNGLPVLPCFLAVPAAPVLPAASAPVLTGDAVPAEPVGGAAAFERFGLTAALRAALPALASADGAGAGAVAADAGAQGAPDGARASATDFDLELALDAGRQVPTSSAASVRSVAEGQSQTLSQQSAAAVSRELPAAGASGAPAVATAVAPLADPSAGLTRSQWREPAAASLPLMASASEPGATAESTAAPAWQLPTASSTSSLPGAAATAPPGAAVDTRSPNWHEVFAGRVQWLVDHHVGEARIKLNPPELGAVDVKISLVDDKTYVQLTAASAAARDELANSLPRLRDLMTASGLELGGASVHGGHGRHDGRDGYESAGRGAEPFGALAPVPEDVHLPQRLRRVAGGVDTFA